MAGITSNDFERRAHFTYIWKIKYAPSSKCCKSPEFTVQSMEMTKWSISLLFFTLDRSIVCWLQRAEDDRGPHSIEIMFELSLLDASGSSLIKKSDTKSFGNAECSQDYKFPKLDEIFYKRRTEFCPKETLTVRCRIRRTKVELSTYELCFARTHFDVRQCSCIWVIKGFSSLKQGEKRVRNLKIAKKGCPQLMLTLFLSMEKGKEKAYIHLEAPRMPCEFTILAEIALLDSEGMAVHLKQAASNIKTDFKTHKLCVFEKSELMSDKTVLTSDGVLVLRCELQLTFDPVWNKIEDYTLMDCPDSKTVLIEKSVTHFNDFNESVVCPFKDIVNKFKEDGTLSDVCLRAGNKTFAVHKLILSSRSPVFKNMFTKDMKESTSKCVDIPDLEADTLSRLLLYIYEDKVEELTWEAAANLFEAADKYELLSLKEKCSNFLKSNLSESNVCIILVLADMHQDENLRKSVQEFIQINSEIMHSDTWKDLKQDHSKLAQETMEQIIYNMKHSNR